MYIAARGPSRRGEGKDMAQRDVEGQVALRLLDELVIRLERRKILPSHDIENIVAELSAQADRMEPSEQKDVIRTAKRRALGWLLPPDERHRRAKSHNRSEEHTSELQSLMRTQFAVFC